MKKSTKIMAIALAALLLVGGAVATTYAYLTSRTSQVENTFTAGKVTISLDEAKVDEYGKVVEGADRVTSNTYKLVPACAYTKDPTIHVDKGSEECYLFIKLSNGLADIEAEGDTTIAKQMKANGWTLIDETNGIYAYGSKVDAREEAKDILVFSNFTIAGSTTNDEISSHGSAKITLIGYACQTAGFNSATEAWNATFKN